MQLNMLCTYSNINCVVKHSCAHDCNQPHGHFPEPIPSKLMAM